MCFFVENMFFLAPSLLKLINHRGPLVESEPSQYVVSPHQEYTLLPPPPQPPSPPLAIVKCNAFFPKRQI